MSDFPLVGIQYKAVDTNFSKTTAEVAEQIRQMNTAFKALAKTMSADMSRPVSQTSASFDKLTKNISVASSEVSGLSKEVSSSVASLRGYTNAALDTARSAIAMGRGIEDVGRSISDFGRYVDGVGQVVENNFSRPIRNALREAISAGVEFEESFTGVLKTVDALVDETAESGLSKIGEKIRQDIIDLSSEVPVLVDELNYIAEIAGQLNVPAEGLVQFTRIIAEFAEATDVTQETSAKALAQAANVYGQSERVAEFAERTSNVIVDLGNNFATTESDILGFFQTFAGGAAAFRVAEQDALAIATAFKSVRAQTASSVSGIQKTFIRMNEAILEGGDLMQKFSNITGLSADQFAAKWEARPALVFRDFLDGLREAGNEAPKLLQSIGLGDVRLIREFLKASQGVDQLDRALERASDAYNVYGEAGARAIEANRRFNTSLSQWKLFVNDIRAMGIAFSEAVLPPIIDLVTAFRPLIQGVTDLLKEYPKLAGLAGVFLTVGGAVGPVVNGFGSLLNIVGAATEAFGSFQKAAAFIRAEGMIDLLGELDKFSDGKNGASTPVVLELISELASTNTKQGKLQIDDLAHSLEEFLAVTNKTGKADIQRYVKNLGRQAEETVGLMATLKSSVASFLASSAAIPTAAAVVGIGAAIFAYKQFGDSMAQIVVDAAALGSEISTLNEAQKGLNVSVASVANDFDDFHRAMQVLNADTFSFSEELYNAADSVNVFDSALTPTIIAVRELKSELDDSAWSRFKFYINPNSSAEELFNVINDTTTSLEEYKAAVVQTISEINDSTGRDFFNVFAEQTGQDFVEGYVARGGRRIDAILYLYDQISLEAGTSRQALLELYSILDIGTLNEFGANLGSPTEFNFVDDPAVALQQWADAMERINGPEVEGVSSRIKNIMDLLYQASAIEFVEFDTEDIAFQSRVLDLANSGITASEAYRTLRSEFGEFNEEAKIAAVTMEAYNLSTARLTEINERATSSFTEFANQIKNTTTSFEDITIDTYAEAIDFAIKEQNRFITESKKLSEVAFSIIAPKEFENEEYYLRLAESLGFITTEQRLAVDSARVLTGEFQKLAYITDSTDISARKLGAATQLVSQGFVSTAEEAIRLVVSNDEIVDSIYAVVDAQHEQDKAFSESIQAVREYIEDLQEISDAQDKLVENTQKSVKSIVTSIATDEDLRVSGSFADLITVDQLEDVQSKLEQIRTEYSQLAAGLFTTGQDLTFEEQVAIDLGFDLITPQEASLLLQVENITNAIRLALGTIYVDNVPVDMSLKLGEVDNVDAVIDQIITAGEQGVNVDTLIETAIKASVEFELTDLETGNLIARVSELANDLPDLDSVELVARALVELDPDVNIDIDSTRLAIQDYVDTELGGNATALNHIELGAPIDVIAGEINTDAVQNSIKSSLDYLSSPVASLETSVVGERPQLPDIESEGITVIQQQAIVEYIPAEFITDELEVGVEDLSRFGEEPISVAIPAEITLARQNENTFSELMEDIRSLSSTVETELTDDIAQIIFETNIKDSNGPIPEIEELNTLIEETVSSEYYLNYDFESVSAALTIVREINNEVGDLEATVTYTVNTNGEAPSPGSSGGSGGGGNPGSPVTLFKGGMIYGRSGVDVIKALVSRGEYVMPRSVMQQPGMVQFLESLRVGKATLSSAINSRAESLLNSVTNGIIPTNKLTSDVSQSSDILNPIGSSTYRYDSPTNYFNNSSSSKSTQIVNTKNNIRQVYIQDSSGRGRQPSPWLRSRLGLI